MTVEEFATIFKRPTIELHQEGFFKNKFDQTGYWARLRSGGCWYWYSVSNSETRIAPDEVAVAITSPDREVERAGKYANSKGVEGFEATVRCREHCYMLGTGGTTKPFNNEDLVAPFDLIEKWLRECP